MNAVEQSAPAPQYDPYYIDAEAVIRLFVVGSAAGLIGWLLYLGVSHYFVGPVFCQSPDTFAICRNGGTIAWTAAHIVALAAAVAVLARAAVYRPLLIVLGVFAALWSAHSWLGGMQWYYAMLWQAALFGLAFAAFGWAARIVNFVASLVVVIALAAVVRVVLFYS